MHEVDPGHGFEQFARHVIGRALTGRSVIQLSWLRFGERDEFQQCLCRDLRMHDDHKVGVIDRRNRCQIAHQFVFALRHQRFIRGLGIRHHQQRITVRRRFGGLQRADHAAGAGPVFDHEGLPETLLQDVADQPGRHIRRAAGAEGNDDLDRTCRIILRQTLRRKKDWRCKKSCRQRKRKPWAGHFNLPNPGLVILDWLLPNPDIKSNCRGNALSTKDSL